MSKPYELVDASEIVDGDQKESARGAEAQRLVERVFQHFGEMVAVEFAGQAVAAGEKSKPALMFIALVDNANDAMGAKGLAVCARKPAAGVLDPQPGFGIRTGTNAVLNLIGNAVAFVTLVRLHDGVETRLRIVGLETMRKSATA